MELNANIEFLQSKEESNIKDRLNSSIDKCTAIRGAVAFWSIRPEYFAKLPEKLANPKSYICVDIHAPTDIDDLAEFVKKNANIYLFMYRKDKEKFPLLHTKFLIFDLCNEQVEIWLGSQNFTYSALEGKNIESTTIITTSKESELYNKLDEYLEFIKTTCEEIGTKLYTEIDKKFNSDYIDFYKKLQGSFDFEEKTHKVLDVLCLDKKDFTTKDKYILITIYDDEKKLSLQVQEKLLIRILDILDSEVIYASDVLSVAEIYPKNESGEHPKLYASHKNEHEISGYIVSKNKTIAVFKKNEPTEEKNKFQIELVIKIGDEFKGELTLSNKVDFWKKDKKNEQNLLYLKLKESEDIYIPKSPDEISKESKYPFDKLKLLDSDNRKKSIEKFLNGENTNDIMELIGKQTIIRKMVSVNNEVDNKEKNNKEKQVNSIQSNLPF